MTNFYFPIDGTIVLAYIVLVVTVGIMVRKYVGKVEHFIVAGREMNVFLGIASLAATEFGILTCVYTAQLGYNYGFAGATPGILTALAMLFVGLTGFCVKPLREAGVLTVPQLFQTRFGSKVRWAAGVVIVLGGLLNMGVFLRVGGEFLLEVTGITSAAAAPTSEHPKAATDPTGATTTATTAAEAPATPAAPAGASQESSKQGGLLEWARAHKLELMMTVLLVAVAVYTILGGMLSVLVTDYFQFIVMSAGLLVVTLLILFTVGWDKIVDSVWQKHGMGGFNPFVHPNMGWQYVLFFACLGFAGVLTWQTMIQHMLSAKDAKTGRKVYVGTSFFFVCRFLIPGLWGIAALAVLAPGVVPAGQSNMAMPIFLSRTIPIGVMGLLLAAMIAADMSTDSTYMLSWASVIYNDILRPFRKNMSEKRGLLLTRCIVAVIGLFLLVYGLWYPLKGDIWTYLGVTGTIYLSSMSILLISCCYWKRANSWGAAGAIFFGAIIPVAYLVAEQLWKIPALDAAGNVLLGPNGQPKMVKWLAETKWPYYAGIATYAFAAAAMVVGSLLKPRSDKPAA